MPRMARLVVPGYPHHVTQRGNRRQRTFFGTSDYQAYIDLLAELLAETAVDVWAYCLMPNHVHLVLSPHAEDSLARLLRDAHSRYAKRVNEAHGWRGHLWQERFHSFVMDESHLLAAVRYVELNPVRAGLCGRADKWRWSSAQAHLDQRTDKLLPVKPMLALVDNWSGYLDIADPEKVITDLRRHSNTGRPAGDKHFIEKLQTLTGRRLIPKSPGPKANS